MLFIVSISLNIINSKSNLLQNRFDDVMMPSNEELLNRKEMIPAPTEVKKQLYEGISRDGQGRYSLPHIAINKLFQSHSSIHTIWKMNNKINIFTHAVVCYSLVAERRTWKCADACCRRIASRSRCSARTSTAGASRTRCPWASSSRPRTPARAPFRTRSTRATAFRSSTRSPFSARAPPRSSRQKQLTASRPPATRRLMFIELDRPTHAHTQSCLSSTGNCKYLQ